MLLKRYTLPYHITYPVCCVFGSKDCSLGLSFFYFPKLLLCKGFYPPSCYLPCHFYFVRLLGDLASKCYTSKIDQSKKKALLMLISYSPEYFPNLPRTTLTLYTRIKCTIPFSINLTVLSISFNSSSSLCLFREIE